MRFTLPLLAVLSIAGAVRSADPRADETGTLAQEYQKTLKESGQVRPNFREAKTDEDRKKSIEATDQFVRRFVHSRPDGPIQFRCLPSLDRVAVHAASPPHPQFTQMCSDVQ
jgi:hypothetical protein